MTTHGQDNSLTFSQGHSDPLYQTSFPKKKNTKKGKKKKKKKKTKQKKKKQQAVWSQIPYGASMGCWC